jgi:hypothetical protein
MVRMLVIRLIHTIYLDIIRSQTRHFNCENLKNIIFFIISLTQLVWNKILWRNRSKQTEFDLKFLTLTCQEILE